MIDWTDKTYRSLEELAKIAFPSEAGVTADTLKRRARKGQLVVYKPGKAYISNLANIWEMVQACKVQARSLPISNWRAPRQPIPDPLGRTDAEIAHDRTQARLRRWEADRLEEKRKRAEERAPLLAAKKLRTKERRRAKAREVYRAKRAKQAAPA